MSTFLQRIQCSLHSFLLVAAVRQKAGHVRPGVVAALPRQRARQHPVYWNHCYTTQTSSEQSGEEELVPERLYSKINVKVKGADNAVLESYCRFVITAAKALNIDIGGRVALPTRIQKFTVLKSPHIYKKHRVQYEIRTHSRLMQVKQITGTTSDVFLEYIQRNLPEGVHMSVYQEELEALPALLVALPEGEEPEPAAAQTARRKSKKR